MHDFRNDNGTPGMLITDRTKLSTCRIHEAKRHTLPLLSKGIGIGDDSLAVTSTHFTGFKVSHHTKAVMEKVGGGVDKFNVDHVLSIKKRVQFGSSSSKKYVRYLTILIHRKHMC